MIILGIALQKAKKTSQLVPVKKTVTRDGHTYTSTFWVLPEQAAEFKNRNLFGTAKPITAQLDLFDQSSEKNEPGDNQNVTQKTKMKNYGWDRVKLAEAYTIKELDELRRQVEKEFINPKDSEGYPINHGNRTVYLYSKEGRKRLDNITWAITYRMQKQKENRTQDATERGLPDPYGKESHIGEIVSKNGKNYKLNGDHEWIDAEEKKLVIKTPTKADRPDDLDPDSPTYKYRDTGYIAGSRKELASERIKIFAREGKLVRVTDIDWKDIEENPRKAHEIITKSNLFGQVDWEALKAEGMEPGAGYLIDRVYASIGKEPENSPESRKDYSNGIESIRNRLEICKTVDDVIKAVDDIDGEMRGEMLNANESKEYQELSEKTRARWLVIREMKDKADAMANEVQKIERQKYPLQSEISKRKNHGWEVDPAMVQRVVEIEQEAQGKRDEYIKFRDKYPAYFKTVTRDRGNGRTGYTSDEEEALNVMNNELQKIKETATARNLLTNPVTRAWLSLGERFQNAINYRHYKGSDTFGNHVATVKSGRVKDWSWADKEKITVKKAKKQSVDFQLRVADKFERMGGRDINIDSTLALKKAFGLRDVQSGNWVLEDVNSAKFHTESAAAAFADLADILGIADPKISLNGRLALAFGARGNGAKGWAGGAPRAHYEPVERVINITKMGGGGCLAHEWFHSFDNMIAEAAGIDTSKEKTFFSTENPRRLENQPELQKAVQDLSSAITLGTHRETMAISYTSLDYQMAKRNIENHSHYYDTRNYYPLSDRIRDAGSAQKAIDIIMKMYGDDSSRREKKNRDSWIRIAAAWYGHNENGGKIEIEHGAPMSSFMIEAKKIDGERKNSYWSTTHEMAARAFQSWCEDKLASMDRLNDYLSVYADNKYYHDPIFGDSKPFPEGDERRRINAAFDRLFNVIKLQNLIQKAIVFENKKQSRKIRLWVIS